MASILVADDAAIVRHIVSEMLRAAGHTVAGQAGTGRDAVRLFAELRPDVSLVDVNMPDGDGISAAHEIRALDPTAGVIVASVMRLDDRRWEQLRQADLPFVPKPFTAVELTAAIDEVVGRML